MEKTENEIAGAAANATIDAIVGQFTRQLANANAQIAVLQAQLAKAEPAK